MLSKDVISWQAWVDNPAVDKNTRTRRKMVLRQWAEANGQDSPQAILDQILLDKLIPYDSTIKYIARLRDEGLASGTVALYRSMLGGEGDAKYGSGFFLSVLGEDNFRVSIFNRLCPMGDVLPETEKRAPSWDEFRSILTHGISARDRSLMGVLANTGFRITQMPLPEKESSTANQRWIRRNQSPSQSYEVPLRPPSILDRRSPWLGGRLPC